MNSLTFFTGTTANGHTSKDHLEIDEKIAKIHDPLLQMDKYFKQRENGAERNVTAIEKNIQDMKSQKCRFQHSESSCIKSVIDDHFKNSSAKNASATGQNDSKPTEKPASALNSQKSSQTAILNTDLTDGIITSKTTDITE